MPGLRRLRDVGSKISGALVGPRVEGADDDAATPPERAGEPVAAPAADAGPPPADTAPEPATAPEEDAPVPDTALQQPTAATAPPAVDEVCAGAVELARAAALELGGDTVGEHLGVDAEPGEGPAVTHSFATSLPGYRGWRWAVTVARAEGHDEVTVDEVVLLPGAEAVLAPAWVPWSDRVRPGDLGPGDLLPPPGSDVRLVPSYGDVDARELPFALHRELGLGRPRVLSREGRLDAAERWYEGEGGPDTPLARQAPGRCASCGFLVLLAGDLGRGFGACANALAPDDGRVVALEHGCGAHSETVTTSAHANDTALAVEHEELELVDVSALPDA